MSRMETPSTIPASPLHVAPSAIIKPSDVSGCVAWLETHSDGTLVNKLAETTGRTQTIIASSDPLNPERGVLLVFDRELSVAEEGFLAEYATGGNA